MDTPFSLSANGYLGPSHFWALVNRTTINMAVQVALWSTGLTSFIYMLRSSIVGSQGNSGCGFSRTRPSTINSGCIHFTVRWWNPYELGLMGRTLGTGPESGLWVSCLFPHFYILCFSLQLSSFACTMRPHHHVLSYHRPKAM